MREQLGTYRVTFDSEAAGGGPTTLTVTRKTAPGCVSIPQLGPAGVRVQSLKPRDYSGQFGWMGKDHAFDVIVVW